MTYLEKLLARLKEQSAALSLVIKAADDEGRSMTADEHEQYAEIKKDVDKLNKSIDVARSEEARKATEALPAEITDGEDESGVGEVRSVAAEPATRLTTVQRIGLISMAVAQSEFHRRGHIDSNPLKVLSENGHAALANRMESEQKRKASILRALNASTAVSGGLLTPDAQANEVMELLRPEVTFLQGNPRRVNLSNGTYRMPAGASGSSAGYRQEGGEIAVSEPTFREVNLSMKFLGGIVPMTQEMIDFTLFGVQDFVETDLRESMGQTMDAKAYFGDGDQGEPLGTLARTDITIIVASDGATLAKIDSDFRKLRLALLNSNIRNKKRWAYTMAPRTLEYLASMRVGSSDGQYAYPSLQGENPTMGGIPVLESTQFPINLGGGTNESMISLINFGDVLFGDSGDVAVATSSEATIRINGALVSAFQNNLVFLRAMHGHDFGLRRPESVAHLTEVTWGA